MIRDATAADVPALVTLERRCFETDRLSRRSFRHLLTRGNASLLVDDADGGITGYSLVLYHRNTSLARLYSFAVDPGHQRRGIARALLERSEGAARNHGAVAMRLEVRVDNDRAIGFYERAGYRRFATYPGYYEDSVDATRLEKKLVAHLPAELASVPYYAQTLEFTCGPACLMMAMKALDGGITLDRMLELRLWREATTVFMTSGHGGCGPFGLALAAWNRGFQVEVHVSEGSNLFVDSVRSAEKKEVIRLVQADLLREIAGTGIRLSYAPLSLAAVKSRYNRGRIPIVLVSAYRLTGDKAPHWMVITGFDSRFVYVHEPYVDVEEGETETMCIGIPILHGEFERMMRYGRSKHYALLVIGPKREKP
ncbi:MAG: GNAT family N-acetyltransferase/peptidase C39 family protein [Hyphomicrobiales bacterium]|nr:GNAT family N-acetyltransferase/peptidase C39 family protein [Hyphomicrobiales bacterium]